MSVSGEVQTTSTLSLDEAEMDLGEVIQKWVLDTEYTALDRFRMREAPGSK